MQNSYAYWRAAHPLVFISLHLLMGILIAEKFSAPQSVFNNTIVILLFGLSLMALISSKLFLKHGFVNGIVTSICLLYWGMALAIISSGKSFSTIPYTVHFINYCRDFVIQKINLTIVNKEANGFALALLLGVKSDMNKSLVNAYAQLGIIHIIAISGMHLDILFKSLTKLTRQLPRKKFYLLIELIVLLFSVWTYTLMAFASPSIVRATVFFSIYTLGKFMNAPIFTLNTIAAGILILLLFDTKGIHHIGLQLSYGAVIGIHLFYKLLFQLLPIDNPIVSYLWSNCCMSLAAQLTTFPILMLHFHQIADWVLVSNFILVPLSNFMLYGLGILLILPIQFPLTKYWANVNENYILYFNELISNWVSNTHSGTLQLSMQAIDIVLYYVILLFVYLWLYLKQPRYLIAVLGAICVFSLLKLFS